MARNGEGNDDPDGVPLGDGSKDFIIVDAFMLHEASSEKARLQFCWKSIGVEFCLENLLGCD